MTRKAVVRLAGLLVLVGIGLALLFVFRQDGEKEAGPLPTGAVSTSAEAQELTTLVRKGRNLTYHAKYRIVGEQLTQGSVRIELWRKDGQARQEQEIRAQGQVLLTAGFVRRDQVISCAKENEKAWVCTAVPESSAEAARDPLIGAVVGELAGKDVEVEATEILGRRVKCYTITDTGQSAEVCITNEGVLVRLKTLDQTMELTDLDRGEIDNNVFDPPVEPAAQPSS